MVLRYTYIVCLASVLLLRIGLFCFRLQQYKRILYMNIKLLRAGCLSWCSESLRARRSGSEPRWGRVFLDPSRSVPRRTQPVVQCVLKLFPGDQAAGSSHVRPTVIFVIEGLVLTYPLRTLRKYVTFRSSLTHRSLFFFSFFSFWD